MKTNKGLIIYLPLLLALLFIAGIYFGYYYKSLHTEEDKFIIYPRADKLSSVLNYIERDYVDPITKDSLIEAAIPRILQQLDPHSQYIPSSELELYNEPLEGNFSGVGIQFNMLNDTLIVIQTIANGPSEKVGILPGDRIIQVNKRKVAGANMPSDSIVNRLRGPRGSKVKVSVERDNVTELLEFEVIRDNIPLYSIDVSYMINDDIGYIKLNKFSATTYQEFMEAMTALQKAGLKKLILDLRNNGGGFMNIAVDIADEFLSGTEMIVYTLGRNRDKEEYFSRQGGSCTNVEVIVLIDENSASASEILAGAIQDNDRGNIVGRRSYGKGLVQEQHKFSDGSAMRLTVARYHTPTGRCIQRSYENGIEDYYNDINARYLHGEFQNSDSIHFNDSLKFTTPKGKIVYGGGGIMPDVFVPYDTVGFTNYLFEIQNNGLLHRFALEFSDKHRKDLKKLNNPQAFIDYVNLKNVLNQFVLFAKENKIGPAKQELINSEFIIKTQLTALIARNIIDNRGYFPIIQTIDNTLHKAIEIFEEEQKK